MMGNYHVRFGGGRLEKEPQGHLVSRLPDNTEARHTYCPQEDLRPRPFYAADVFDRAQEME